jgi:hypothetical protein
MLFFEPEFEERNGGRVLLFLRERVTAMGPAEGVADPKFTCELGF